MAAGGVWLRNSFSEAWPSRGATASLQSQSPHICSSPLIITRSLSDGQGSLTDSSSWSRKCLRMAWPSRAATAPLQSESPQMRLRVNGVGDGVIGAGVGVGLMSFVSKVTVPSGSNATTMTLTWFRLDSLMWIQASQTSSLVSKEMRSAGGSVRSSIAPYCGSSASNVTTLAVLLLFGVSPSAEALPLASSKMMPASCESIVNWTVSPRTGWRLLFSEQPPSRSVTRNTT